MYQTLNVVSKSVVVTLCSVQTWVTPSLRARRRWTRRGKPQEPEQKSSERQHGYVRTLFRASQSVLQTPQSVQACRLRDVLLYAKRATFHNPAQGRWSEAGAQRVAAKLWNSCPSICVCGKKSSRVPSAGRGSPRSSHGLRSLQSAS